MPASFSVSSSATITAFGYSLFAIIAGIAIFPEVFSFGVGPEGWPRTCLYYAAANFSPNAGRVLRRRHIFPVAFRGSVFVDDGALGVLVALAIERFGGRKLTATAVIGILTFALGLPAAMSVGLLSDIQISRRGILDAVDTMVSNFLLPMGGILIAIFVGWHVNRTHAHHDANLTNTRLGSLWIWLLRYLVSITITAILLQSIGVI